MPAAASARADEESDVACPRVRAYDRYVAALMTEGYSRSRTFRELVQAVNQTDVIVYVVLAPSRWPTTAYLQFAGATPRERHLQVVLTLVGGRTWSIATLAHELQHALEVAGASEVRDRQSFLHLYERIGDRKENNRFDTLAARQVTYRVWAELDDSREDVAQPPPPDLVATPR